jgi:hypothetical protein
VPRGDFARGLVDLHPSVMLGISLWMLVSVLIALAILGLVMAQARAEGREVFTPEGEDALEALRERAQAARDRARR